MQVFGDSVQCDWDAYAERDCKREACSSLFFENMKALYSLERNLRSHLFPHFDPDIGKDGWIKFLTACKFLSGKIVIDSGCGTGRDAVVAAAFGARVFACDSSENAIEKLIQRSQNEGVQDLVSAYVAEVPQEVDGLGLADFVHLSGVVPYRDEESFTRFMEDHMEMVKLGGFISVDFFGERHFKAIRGEEGLTFMTNEEICKFFERRHFTVVYLNENFGPRMLSDETVEDWHVINVLAQNN